MSKAIIQTDGASRGNPGPASIGGVIWDYEGQVIAEVSKAIGIATSNVAEYRALVETLAKALELGVEFVDIRLDSELIVRQVNGSYRTRKPKLKNSSPRSRSCCSHSMGMLSSTCLDGTTATPTPSPTRPWTHAEFDLPATLT